MHIFATATGHTDEHFTRKLGSVQQEDDAKPFVEVENIRGVSRAEDELWLDVRELPQELRYVVIRLDKHNW